MVFKGLYIDCEDSQTGIDLHLAGKPFIFHSHMDLLLGRQADTLDQVDQYVVLFLMRNRHMAEHMAMGNRSSGFAPEVLTVTGAGNVAALPADLAGHITETAGLAFMSITVACAVSRVRGPSSLMNWLS